MANDTRERILYEALRLFSENGYAGTNLQSIADGVGIVKSALYRHYESKAEIWKAVLEMMRSYYGERFGTAERPIRIPESTLELYEMTMEMTAFTVHDENVIRMRRIILTEQFRNDTVRRLATRYFIDDTKAIFEKVFESMIEKGLIKEADAGFLAFSYTAPITALVHRCDREPDNRPEIIADIEDFVKRFIDVYGIK